MHPPDAPPDPHAPPGSPPAVPAKTTRPFARTRWLAALFVVVWLPAYALQYGWANFLHLCDVTVFLTAAGIWWANPVILSSQAPLAMVVNFLWIFDVATRLLIGRHLMGGTEYMWNSQLPLFVRLLSLFHVVLPPVLIAAVRRTGYDRRGLPLAITIVAVLFLVSWLFTPAKDNFNFVFRDPFFHRSFGSPAVHLGLTIALFTGVVIWPTHAIFARLFPHPSPVDRA